jgi:aspartate racemase
VRTLGLIGGLSWESTVPYYTYINQAVKQRLGGLHSARLILYSVDFDDIQQLMHADDWDGAGAALAAAAHSLEGAAIESAVRIPLLHIIDATGAAIAGAGLHTVGLLGTRFTMEQPFYRDRLQASHGIKALSPDASDRAVLHSIIFEELCLGRVVDASRADARRIMRSLVAQGAQGIILGCTELAMLIGPADVSVPLFDTTAIHASHAVDWALAGVTSS